MTEVMPQKASLMELTLATAPRVRIEEVRLANSTVRSQLDTISGRLTAGYGFDARTEIDEQHKKLVVHASLKACGKNDSESGAIVDDQVVIEAEFVLTYGVDSLDGISQESAHAFGRINGIHNVWPYWREYVQSTTVRLGLPALTLPPVTGTSLLEYYASKAELGER